MQLAITRIGTYNRLQVGKEGLKYTHADKVDYIGVHTC